MCFSGDCITSASTHLPHSSDFLLPLLCLTTGARVAEPQRRHSLSHVLMETAGIYFGDIPINCATIYMPTQGGSTVPSFNKLSICIKITGSAEAGVSEARGT